MGSPPPVQLEVEVEDEAMDEEPADLLPTYRYNLVLRAEAVVEVWRGAMAEGVLAPSHFHDHWRLTVPRVYSPQPNRNCLDWSWDDELVNKLLIRPLEQFVWGAGDGHGDAAPRSRRATLCGKVFKQGEPAYSCRECGMDNTCVLCVECFKVSAHRHHKYKMGQSGGGGFCDCGDTEAWKRDPFCQLHSAGNDDMEQEECAPPQEVVERMKIVASVALAYCFRLLTLEHTLDLPNELRLKETDRDPMQILDQPDCYCTVLYNDETHTFEQVIATLMRVMKCPHRDAVELVSHIDREGRALLRCNSFPVCEKLKSDIDKYASRHGPGLKVVVMHAHVIAHQTFAMKLLNWLQTFVSQEQALRVALSQVELGEEAPLGGGGALGGAGGAGALGGGGIAAGIMQNDCRMWKAARTACHRLLIATTLMDYNTKKSLAILFTKNYATILKDYIRDDHDHSFSVSSLAVQLYTTPTLAHHLIAAHDALYIVLNTFVSECVRRCNKHGRLEFERNNTTQPFKRAQHILYDVKYLLSAAPAPAAWSDELRRGFLHGLTLLLNLLAMMQGMDEVARQVGQHMEYEPEWESAFNLHVKLAHCVSLALAWCARDRTLAAKAYRLTLKKLHDLDPPQPNKFTELCGQSAMVIPYDVSTQPVSIHLPLSRFAAGLHLLLHAHGLGYHSDEFNMPKPLPEQLIEPVLRTATMIAQVHAGMWRRNGYAILNQLYFYHNVKCRVEMLDRDVVMLQIGASLIESNEFLIHVLNKFGLLEWADPGFEEQPIEDDALRQTVSLVEEFLGLLIAVIGARYVPGVGEVTAEDRTKKEIIQMLCVKPMPHSELNRSLPEDELHETGLEAVIHDVAEFSKPTGANQKGMYTLKPHLHDEYDTFYYHYTREELSKSEEAQRNRKKAAGLPECCPPPALPKLAPPFALLAQLLQSDAALHVLSTVLRRALDLRARSFSEAQVHKALHLIGYALRDELSGHYEFVAFSERAARAGLMELLRALHQAARVEAHRPLVAWTLATMRKALGQTDEGQGDGDKGGADTRTEPGPSDASKADAAKERRVKLAAERRAKLMAQMAAAQKNFISKNATLFHETSAELPAAGSSGAELPAAEPEPPASHAALPLLAPAKPDAPRLCIMCQEEGRVEAGADPMVLVAFVQYSTVFNRRRHGSCGLLPPEWTEAWLISGVGPAPQVSSCGHELHARCWHNYVDHVVLRENRRPYRLRQPSAFDVEKQEYLCPLCKRLCNTALPLLPAPLACLAPAPPAPGAPLPPLADELYLQAVRLILKHQVSSEAVHRCTELCHEIQCVARAASASEPGAGAVDMESSTHSALSTHSAHSTEPDSTEDTPMYLSTHSRPLLPAEFTAHLDDDHAPAFNESTKSLVKQFALMVNSVCGEAGSTGGAAQVAGVYRATAYSVLCCEGVLAASSPARPLLGELPARHKDALAALVRLAAALPATWPAPRQLAHHAMRTLSTLATTSPLHHTAFSTALVLTLTAPSLFAKQAPPAKPSHIARQFTLHCFRATLTRAMMVADLQQDTDDSMDHDADDSDDSDKQEDLRGLLDLVRNVRNDLKVYQLDARHVWQRVQLECRSFLRCCCLFFHFLSDASPPPELQTAGGDTWASMCRYLGMPATFQDLLGREPARSLVLEWAAMPHEWSGGEIPYHVVREPLSPPRLITLPEDFSELMNVVSVFSCPNSEREDSKYPTMCLVCGQILCSQSYCCQTELNKEHVGAVVAHGVECGGGAGMFVRVRDCELLLLAAPNRGAMMPAPYLDLYGETDQGLRRGNPLTLCRERYEKLRLLWLSHDLHERIARDLDTTSMVATQWQNM